jgi:hypothetical protein
MASFTETQPPKFNPYVQQQPIEAMVAVGTQKQKAYEEGVQKIQTQIDNIAGLDVVRDVDKAYLQSKLNQLGNNLRTVAAGDFSNFQLVNSVGGMTKSLIRDDGIKNAVASTAKYRKEVATMEEAKKAGKSSIANQWVFGKDSMDWINSTDQKQSYNVSYNPYVDVNKKWMETMKSLHPDLVEQDIPYEKNADGSINYSKTASAMQRMSKETVSAGKIANALSASMSPEELNQLNIEGRYTFRGQTPASLAAQAESKYNSNVGTNNERIKELEGLIKLSASNPELQKKAQDSIESLKLQNSELKTNHEGELATIAANPELAKGIIYKNGAIAQFAKANSWEHNKSNLLSNPVLEAEHWEKNNALEKSKFALSIRKQNADERKDAQDLYFKNADLDLKQKTYLLSVAKQQADQFGLSSDFESYGGASTKVKDPMTAMITEANTADAAASAGIVELVRAMPGTNSTQIKQALDKYQKGDPNWFKTGTDSRSIIPVTLRDKADEIIQNRKLATRLNTGIKQSIDEVDKSTTMKQNTQAVLESVKDLPPIVGVDANGKRIEFSKKEVVDFIRKQEDQTAIAGGGGFGLSLGNKYSAPLTNREKLLEKFSYGSNRPILNEYTRAAKTKIIDLKNTRDDLIEASLLKKGSTFIPRQSSIAFSSSEGGIARRTWEGTINTALAPYGDRLNEGGVTGGTEELTKGEYDEAKEWISGKDKDDIIYSKIEQGSKTFIQMTLKGKDILVPINKNSVSRLPMTDKGSPSPQYKDVVSAQMIGNGSTNPTGKFEDSYFDNTNIKGTRLNIGADLEWNKSNTDKQYISLKLNTPIGFMPLMIETPVDRDGAIQYIQGLNDKKIKELYLGNANIPDAWKAVIKNL